MTHIIVHHFLSQITAAEYVNVFVTFVSLSLSRYLKGRGQRNVFRMFCNGKIWIINNVPLLDSTVTWYEKLAKTHDYKENRGRCDYAIGDI